MRPKLPAQIITSDANPIFQLAVIKKIPMATGTDNNNEVKAANCRGDRLFVEKMYSSYQFRKSAISKREKNYTVMGMVLRAFIRQIYSPLL